MQPVAGLGVAVRVVAEHERHMTSVQLTDRSSGSVTVTLYWSLSPKENRPPSIGP